MIGGRRSRLVLVTLLLALVLFNAPAMTLVDALGPGVLPVFVFAAWAVVIVLAAVTLHWRMPR